MSRAVSSLLVVSLLTFPASAEDKKDGDSETVVKAPTRAEMLASKLTFSHEITRVTKHRLESGLPDYAAAINEHFGKGVKPEENGAILLYECLGPNPERSDLDDEFFELMGMKRPPANRKYFKPFAFDLPAEKAREVIDGEFNIAMTRPWTDKECPEVAKWLKKNGKHVVKAVAGAKKPKYFSPLIVPDGEDGQPIGLVGCLLPGIQESRSLARFLICRALNDIAKGNAEAAWTDLMDCHRIGNMIAKGPTLIEALVGMAINSIAASGDAIFLDQIEMTPAEISRRRKELASLPIMPPLVEQLDWCERLMYLDCVLLLGTGHTKTLDLAGARLPTVNEGALKAIMTRVAIISVDWNTCMRIGNEMYDKLIVGLKKDTHVERAAALAELDEVLNQKKQNTSFAGFLKVVAETGSSRTAASEMVANMLVALLMPAMQAVNSAHTRTVQTRANINVAYALAEWKTKNGSYPKSLDQLVSAGLLKSAPIDHFDGKPLKYVRGDEGFLIYSIGQNGEDEGGRWYDDEPQGDDPRIRIPIPEEELLREDR